MYNRFLNTTLLLFGVIVATLPVARGQDGEAGNYGEMASSGSDTPEFHIMGFGDISYISRDGNNNDGFVIGQGVAHVSAYLGQSLGVFSEISATGRDSGYSMEIERLIVKYDFSDQLKVSAGRYHTPMGYWNSAFHHGAWLQTTTSRPEMVKFGSKILPIHFVGLLAEGNLPNHTLGLSYKVGFGNGRHANIGRAGDAGDINGDKAWMTQVQIAPESRYGLVAGLGYYNDEVAPGDRPPIKEGIVSAFAAWTRESPEIILEYLRSDHESVVDSSDSGNTRAWYAQFGYRLKGDKSLWKPYARLEDTNVDSTDPLLFDQGLDYDARILGVRWDFNPYAALKFEYRNEEFNNAGRENNFRVQLSFVLSKL